MEPYGDSWRSKLSDLGSANLQNHVNTEDPGNRHYAAPEAKDPDKQSPLMDIYSLGIVIMVMENHESPKERPKDRAEQIRLMKWSEMKTITAKCTEKDYGNRPNAQSLLKDLSVLN